MSSGGAVNGQPRPTAGSGVGNTAVATGLIADTQKQKRARTSKPKVKTGCNNCKQRRIKCDERRPSCMNCVRSKKLCTGYPPPSRNEVINAIRIAPKPIAVESTPPPGRQPTVLPPRRMPRNQSQNQRRITPPPTPVEERAMPVMLYRPSMNLPFDEQEGMYFQLFQQRTGDELSGFFDSVFWSRTVLQECHSEATIRHATVALGALYRTLGKTHESPPGSPTGHHDPQDSAASHWEVALKQYSDACNALVSVNRADPTSHRTRLMASVLLACFDSFIGDHKQAIKQIQNGLGLLEQLRAERRRAFIPKAGEPVEEELVQMFRRLALQAKSYDMAFHFPHPFVVQLTSPSNTSTPDSQAESDCTSPGSTTSKDSIPDQFSTVLEARVAWDALCERVFVFTEAMFAFTQSGKSGVLPANLLQHGKGFKKEIEEWSAAFYPILMGRTAPGVTHQEKASIAVLKMFQEMGQILFLMTFSGAEIEFDKHQQSFQAIVDLAQEVVGDEERRAAARRCPNPHFCQHHGQNGHFDYGDDALDGVFVAPEYTARHIKPSFSADLGIVPPLFVVATKCRNPITRRQAIQLLRSSARREGMWDSELAARIGSWIAKIEEESEPPFSTSVNTVTTLLTPPSDTPMIYGIGIPTSTSRQSSSGDPSIPPPTQAMNAALKAEPQPSMTLPSRLSIGSVDFGDAALGPGGNARWDVRRESQVSALSSTSGQWNSRTHHWHSAATVPPRTVPEDKRVMVRAVEFDLRERFAVVQLGTRGLYQGVPDMKMRVAKIEW